MLLNLKTGLWCTNGFCTPSPWLGVGVAHLANTAHLAGVAHPDGDVHLACAAHLVDVTHLACVAHLARVTHLAGVAEPSEGRAARESRLAQAALVYKMRLYHERP